MSTSTATTSSQKRPSRSNSISSSIVTVKKSASVSSRTGPRTSYLRNRSTSPDSISRVLHSLNSSRSDFRPRSDVSERKAGANLHVNRWSHSTSSSLSAIDADLIKKRTSSRRSAGSGYSSTPLAASSQPNNHDHRSEIKGSPKRSSSTNNRASPRPGSRLAFQDSSNLRIVQDLSQQSNAVNSTWEHNSGTNKFGEPIQSLSIHYNPTANQSAQNGVSSTQTNHNTLQVNQTPHPAPAKPGESSRQRERKETSNASDSSGHAPSHTESRQSSDTKSPKRRDMLSRALAKANEAVLLDNGQEVNAAIEAYNDACELLQQVMIRSVDLADRKKLSSIKATYSRRIAELHDYDNTFVDLMRPLPEDPPVDDYENPEDFYQEDLAYQNTAINDAPSIQLPLRQESLLPEIFGGDNFIHDRTLPPVPNPIPSTKLNVPMDQQYMPPPLSPRPLFGSQPSDLLSMPTQPTTEHQNLSGQNAAESGVAQTWLDQSDTQSSKSSSRLSSFDYDRKDNQLMSAIEAEFDAMNAAVDAAYDDVLDQESTPRNDEADTDFLNGNRFDPLTGTYLDNDAEQEEQLLETITQQSDLNQLHHRQTKAPAPPRKSDSSSLSGRTWGSSVASTTATTRTTLSTLAEIIEPPLHAPPTTALPEPPRSPPKKLDTEKPLPLVRPPSSDRHVGIRDRRMSGQSAKQLKIETFARRSSVTQQTDLPPPSQEPLSMDGMMDVAKEIPVRTLAPAASFSSSLSGAVPLTPMLSVHSDDLTIDGSPATPALTHGTSTDDGTLMDPSPSRYAKIMPPPSGPIVRKNLSSSNLGKGSLSINTGHLETDSPITPGSAMFPSDARKPSSAATSATSTASSSVLTSMAMGGMYLFEDHVGTSRGVQSPGQQGFEPIPLEPCPEAFLLRPFWLMRCLYQALAHPRGGYVSTKVFIPRDIWRVRNVKIKALEDKIAQCDLLTAALQKLAKVDTLDAAAVLDELQTFELILDQVRLALSRKLGGDVGIPGGSGVFKSSTAVEESTEAHSAKSSNSSFGAKSLASSWRKLRSKSSSAALSSSTRQDLNGQTFTMSSLPMTTSASVATSRSHSNAKTYHPPPTPTDLPQLLAPHAHYMSSLARLFDAAQVLDGIARQVEDPGLKHSSTTHVGLELSIRNAAEFFAFYIIRFVMSDVLMLLDKFLKRGGEWVTC